MNLKRRFERKTASGDNRMKSHMWLSTTGASVSPRSCLPVGDGGAGMLLRMMGVTLLQHCYHIGIVDC